MKGHGNEADFLGVFAEIWFLIDPLQYLSNRSAFGFDFTEIFIIEKRMFNRKLEESGSRHGESGSRYSNFFEFSINFSNFKWLNQPFQKSIGKKKAWDVMYYHHLFI